MAARPGVTGQGNLRRSSGLNCCQYGCSAGRNPAPATNFVDETERPSLTGGLFRVCGQRENTGDVAVQINRQGFVARDGCQHDGGRSADGSDRLPPEEAGPAGCVQCSVPLGQRDMSEHASKRFRIRVESAFGEHQRLCVWRPVGLALMGYGNNSHL